MVTYLTEWEAAHAEEINAEDAHGHLGVNGPPHSTGCDVTNRQQAPKYIANASR